MTKMLTAIFLVLTTAGAAAGEMPTNSFMANFDRQARSVKNFTPVRTQTAQNRCGRGFCGNPSDTCCSSGSTYWCCPYDAYCGNGGGCGH